MVKCVAKPRLVKGVSIIARAVTTKTAPVLRARRDRHQTKLYQAPDTTTPQKKMLPKKPVAKKLKKAVPGKKDTNNNKVIKKGKGGKVEKGKKKTEKKTEKKTPKKGNDRLKKRDGIQIDKENPFLHSSTAPIFVSGSTYHRWLIRALVKNSSAELKTVMKSNRLTSEAFNRPFSYADSRTADGVASVIKDSKLAEEYQKLKEGRDEKKTIQEEPNLLQRRSTGLRNFYMLGRATRNIEMSRGGREGNNAFLNYEQARNLHEQEEGLRKLVEENTEYKELMRRSQMKSQPFSMSSLETELVTAVRRGHCELAFAIATSAEAQYSTNELHRSTLKIGGKLPQKILGVSVVKKAFSNRNITPLHTAAINPDGAKMLEQLRSADPNINIPDQDNWYTIHYAAVNRHPGALQFLLRNGATPTMLNKKQQSPLHVACIAGRVETTKVLLEAIQKMEKGEGTEGPKPEKSLINARTKDGNTALLHAVKHGRVEVIKALLDCETVLVDAPSSTTTNKLSPLMVACSIGNLEVVRLLVEKGALVEGKDKKRRTALHHAVLNGQQHTAAFLLSMGTDLLKGDSSGNTSAHYAAAYGWLNCLQLLADVDPECLSQENDWKLTPLTVAFLKGHYGVVSWLLDGQYKDHVNINGKDTEGYTLLSCLLAFSDPNVHYQLPEQIDYLLTRGADCSLTDSYNNTILHDFASLTVKLVGPGQKDKQGMTEKQYQACFDKLVRQAPESVKARNRNGDTPMHLALQQGNLLSFTWMLARIDVRQFFKDKWTSTTNVLHSLLILPITVWNSASWHGNPSPAAALYDILPILKKLQEAYPTEFKEWLLEKNAENQVPVLAFTNALSSANYNRSSEINPTPFIEYLSKMLDWICDIQPDTPSILIEKTEKTPTMSLIAKTFQISLEEGSHQLLQTLLKKAVQHKIIEKILHQEIDGLPLIFVSFCDTAATGILLRFARENNCTKGVHDAVWKWEDEGNKRKEVNKSLLMVIIEKGAFDLALELDMDQAAWMAKDADGNSAWHYAAKSNHHRTLSLMKVLEGHKIPLEPNARGCTPLHVAVQACDGGANSVLEPIEWLVTRSNVADQDTFGRTAMHYAFGSCSGANDIVIPAQSNDPIAVVSILAADVNERLLNATDVHGNTVLHLAAASGANICSVTLLRKGAKVDLKNNEGNTPLALAVRYGRLGVALTLIQANSNVTDKVYIEKKKQEKQRVEWIWNSLKEIEQPTAPSSIPAQIVKRGTDWAAMVYVLLDTLGKNASSLAQIAACALREEQYNLANQLLKSLEAILDGQPLQSGEDLIVTFSESCRDVAIPLPVLPVTIHRKRLGHVPPPVINNIQRRGLEPESVERTVLERLLIIGCPILQNGASPALEIALFNQAWPLADFLKEKMGAEAWSQLKPVHTDEGPLKALLATGSQGGREFSRWIDHIIGLRHLSTTTCSMTLPVPRDLKGLVEGKFTALGWAALNGSVDLIYFLRAKGFDVNAADEQGRTPLMLAMLANKDKAVEALADEKTSKAVERVTDNKNRVQVKMSLGNHLAFTLNGRKRKAPESEDEDDEDEDKSSEDEEEAEKNRTPLKKLKITNKNLNLELKDKRGRNIFHYMVEPMAWENTELLDLLAKEKRPLIKKLLLEKDKDGNTPTILAVNKKQGTIATAMAKISEQNVKVQPTPLPSVAHLGCPYDISADSAAYIKKFAEENDKKKTNEQEDKPHRLSGYGETGTVVKCSQTNQYFKVLMNKSDMSYGRYGFHNFYRMELIKRRDTDLWNIFTNWGRIGSGDGEFQNTPFTSLEAAVKEFCSIFKAKAGQEWLPLENFVEIKKKYRLVKVDKSPTSLAELKLPALKKEDEKDEVRAFVRDISDPEKLKEYQKNVRSSLSIVSPFGRVTKAAIERGREVLKECEKVAKKIEKAMNDNNADQEKLIQLLNTANDLSSEFYTVIPSGNAEFSSLQRFDNEAAINQALTQLNRMSEIEIAARILTASAHREDVERISYIQKAMECEMRAMTPDEPMSQYILQWIHNTKNEEHKIMGLLEIAPKVSVSNFQKFAAEGNQKYLLHGTRAVNLLSLLRDGFLIDPQNTQINGRLFGDGIYLADCFGKSHSYCQESSRGWKYMFVCQVSFGKLAIRDKDEYQEENLKSYDSLYMKGTCYPECAITIDGVSMPLGAAKDTNTGYWRNNYSEYIVHDPMRAAELLEALKITEGGYVSVAAMLLPLVVVALFAFGDAASYTDSFGRNTILPLSSAAYSSNPQTCLTKIFGGTLKRQLNVKYAGDTVSGYTATLPKEKAIVISFRGTQGFLQLVQEADQSAFAAQISWIAGGKVSKYFGDAFTALWNGGMKNDFTTLRNANPSYEVWVTGHSLGGALASLAASWLVASNIVPGSQVKLVTLGQPRTGDKAFSAAHDKQMAFVYRVTHWRDLVPHVPMENFEGYYHHKAEAWYKEAMGPSDVTVCTADEDTKCSDGLDVTTSLSDHLTYFGKDVSGYGEGGCK